MSLLFRNFSRGGKMSKKKHQARTVACSGFPKGLNQPGGVFQPAKFYPDVSDGGLASSALCNGFEKCPTYQAEGIPGEARIDVHSLNFT
jgi:hypothetical protein